MALKTMTRGWFAICMPENAFPPALLTDIYPIGLEKTDDGRDFFVSADT